MGALTNNRYKRHAEFQSSSPSAFDHDHPHIPKKLKSSSYSTFIAPTKSLISRLRSYPQQLSPIVGEIQAPCVIVKGFTTSSKILNSSCSEHTRQKSDICGGRTVNSMFLKYNRSKEAAIGSCRYVNFVMEDDVVEVTDVDDVQIVNDDNDASGDSGVEEIAMVESEKEDVDKLGEVEAIRAKYRELDGKVEENRGFRPSASAGVVSELIDGKPLESLSLNQRTEAFDLDALYPYYKKLLYDSSERRDVQLRRLSFDIRLVEEKRALSKQLFPVKKDEAKKDEDILIEAFRPLDEDDLEMVANAMSNSSRRKVLVTHENSNITIAGEVLRCLRPGAWLND